MPDQRQNIPWWEEVFGEREATRYWDLGEVLWRGSSAFWSPERKGLYWTRAMRAYKIYFRCHLCHSQALIDDPTFKLDQLPSDWQLFQDPKSPDVYTCLNDGCHHSCRNCLECRMVTGYVRAVDSKFIVKDSFDGIDRMLVHGFRRFDLKDPMVCIAGVWINPGFTYQELFGTGVKPERTFDLENWVRHKRYSREVPSLYAHCCQCGLPKTHPNSWLYYRVAGIDYARKNEQLECVQAHPNHNPWQCTNYIRVLAKLTIHGHIFVEWLFPDSFVAGRSALLQNPLFRTTIRNRSWCPPGMIIDPSQNPWAAYNTWRVQNSTRNSDGRRPRDGQQLQILPSLTPQDTDTTMRSIPGPSNASTPMNTPSAPQKRTQTTMPGQNAIFPVLIASPGFPEQNQQQQQIPYMTQTHSMTRISVQSLLNNPPPGGTAKDSHQLGMTLKGKTGRDDLRSHASSSASAGTTKNTSVAESSYRKLKSTPASSSQAGPSQGSGPSKSSSESVMSNLSIRTKSGEQPAEFDTEASHDPKWKVKGKGKEKARQ